jgi:hypothetical protein
MEKKNNHEDIETATLLNFLRVCLVDKEEPALVAGSIFWRC